MMLIPGPEEYVAGKLLARVAKPIIKGCKIKFKKPLARVSGKEGAKNIPSWARGNRPYEGENGKDFAKRLMDDKYGSGKWSGEGAGSEYNQIKKWGDRSFE